MQPGFPDILASRAPCARRSRSRVSFFASRLLASVVRSNPEPNQPVVLSHRHCRLSRSRPDAPGGRTRIWRTGQGDPFLGSFHGNMLTSASARASPSMATAYGCAGISSGRISSGRLALAHEVTCHGEDESGLVRYILVRNLSTSPSRSRAGALSAPGPTLHIVVVEKIAHLRTGSLGCAKHGGDNTIRRPPAEIPDEGAPMQNPAP